VRDSQIRRERLVHAIRDVLSELLLVESKDPRLHGVVISSVELSGDAKRAVAYFSVIGDAERERQAADGLQQARHFLQHQVGRRIRLHNAPELEFRRDLGFERSDRVQRILDQLAQERTDDE
jgi:ribosome-binding factor A